MDTSKEYILMCEKAVKIQELWKPSFGDYAISLQGRLEIITKAKNPSMPDFLLCSTFGEGGRTEWRQLETLNGFIWLPRQDQLQEMINEVNYHKVWNFYEFVMDDIGSESKKSMEQLWLAYVMRHKYNKIWNGKDWKSV